MLYCAHTVQEAPIGGLFYIIPVFKELYFTTFSNKHNKEISVNSIKEAVVSPKLSV